MIPFQKSHGRYSPFVYSVHSSIPSFPSTQSTYRKPVMEQGVIWTDL
ncbi:MAG: hypothetical protein GY757_54715 [bacterium]|nr:hypothetical protein [bacterium]